jgi:hypothetical protein
MTSPRENQLLTEGNLGEISSSRMFHYIHEELEKRLVPMLGQLTLIDPY